MSPYLTNSPARSPSACLNAAVSPWNFPMTSTPMDRPPYLSSCLRGGYVAGGDGGSVECQRGHGQQDTGRPALVAGDMQVEVGGVDAVRGQPAEIDHVGDDGDGGRLGRIPADRDVPGA